MRGNLSETHPSEREREGGYRGREVDGLLCWAVDYGGLGFSNVR